MTKQDLIKEIEDYLNQGNKSASTYIHYESMEEHHKDFIIEYLINKIIQMDKEIIREI